MQVLKGLCREEKEIEIWKVRKLCLKSENYMSTWNRKLNWLFKENAQLRDDYLRLKQTRTQEIGNKEILILPFMKSIEKPNLQDWSCTKRSNAQRENITLCGELEMRNRLFQESRSRNCQEMVNYDESVAKKQIESDT